MIRYPALKSAQRKTVIGVMRLSTKKKKKKQKPTEANYSFQNLILKQENHSALLPVLPILKNLTTILGISDIIC